MARAVERQLLRPEAPGPAGELVRALRTSGAYVEDAELLVKARSLEICGHDFELCFLPSRAARQGVPTDERPSFLAHPGHRIRREEALWTRGRLVATPNRFPFFGPSLLLWEGAAADREPSFDREVRGDWLVEAFALQQECGAVLVGNTVGAAASIPLAHAHLLLGRRPLLAASSAWPLVEVACPQAGLRILATDPAASWPIFAGVVECEDAEERARWVRALLDARSRASANVLAQDARAFVVPRRQENGAEDFPYAIGGGELSGRFIYADEKAYVSATRAGLEASLRRACVPSRDAEVASLRKVCDAIAADGRA